MPASRWDFRKAAPRGRLFRAQPMGQYLKSTFLLLRLRSSASPSRIAWGCLEGPMHRTRRFKRTSEMLSTALASVAQVYCIGPERRPQAV